MKITWDEYKAMLKLIEDRRIELRSVFAASEHFNQLGPCPRRQGGGLLLYSALKNARGKLTFKVGEKGGVVYGMDRFPLTQRQEQWYRLEGIVAKHQHAPYDPEESSGSRSGIRTIRRWLDARKGACALEIRLRAMSSVTITRC